MDTMKIKRMFHRKNKNRCLIYPENKFKMSWDLFMTVVLLITCVMTPLEIAFDEPGGGMSKLTIVIDSLFLLDIVIIFNTVYYDEDVNLIDDRPTISMNYLKGWFFIDLLAIVPFDLILNATSGDYSGLVRIARVGRLYKLVKLTRLLRILKIVKEKSKLLKYIGDMLRLGLGFERLFFFILLFFILCHIGTCLWIIMSTLVDEEEETWIYEFKQSGMSNGGLYLVSFYWTITTITTVGYGDIGGSNNLERFFCAIMMIIGVIAFSFANGSLASIISNYDSTNAQV